MKHYIGVKLITASPALRIDGVLHETDEKFTLPALPDTAGNIEEGYKVVYPDGYTSFSPRKVFEDAYYPLEDPTKISDEDVKNFIVVGESRKMGEKSTVVLDKTLTGFELVATSSCVSTSNYDDKIGMMYARERNYTELFSHLGFVLQWAINGLKRVK